LSALGLLADRQQKKTRLPQSSGFADATFSATNSWFHFDKRRVSTALDAVFQEQTRNSKRD